MQQGQGKRKLKTIREEEGYTQPALIERAKQLTPGLRTLSQSTLWRAESGKRITRINAKGIVKALGVALSDVVEFEYLAEEETGEHPAVNPHNEISLV